MKRLGIHDKAIKAVEGCVNSVEGQWALHDLGVETTILQPAPTFIPQINFNGVNKMLNIKDISLDIYFSHLNVIHFQVNRQEWQDGAVDDFEDLLCKRWLISVPECKTRNRAKL